MPPFVAALAGSTAWKVVKKLWPLWLALALFAVGYITLKVHDSRVRKEAIAAERVKVEQCNAALAIAMQELKRSAETIENVSRAYANQAEMIEELARSEAEARARGDKQMAEYRARERRLRVQIQKLEAELAMPAETPEMACEKADEILLDLAARQKAEMP